MVQRREVNELAEVESGVVREACLDIVATVGVAAETNTHTHTHMHIREKKDADQQRGKTGVCGFVYRLLGFVLAASR